MVFLPDLTDPAIFPVYVGAIVVAGLVVLGGRPERWGFAILAFMLAFQVVGYSLYSKPRFNELDLVAFGADVAGLIGFVLLTRKSERVWPAVAVSMVMLSLLGHFARTTQSMLGPSYAHLQSGPTVVILIVLPIAVLAHQWRLRSRGFDRDWTPIRTDKALRKAAKRVALQKN